MGRSDWSCTELRERLKERDLPYGGKKADLLAWLQEAQAQDEGEGEGEGEGEAEGG